MVILNNWARITKGTKKITAKKETEIASSEVKTHEPEHISRVELRIIHLLVKCNMWFLFYDE